MSGTGIRLLGAVEAEVGGSAVDLGGPRQRRLTAALALRAGRRVAIGEIIDAVWPDGDLPPRPNDALYTYVHRLRRSLGDQAIVETKQGTYRITLADDDVDALLFERLVTGHRSQDPERRIEALERALALWRGPALSGFEHEEWARPHAVRLSELRALAADELGEARIAIGRYGDAIVGLEGAAAEHPLREASHRLLMTALHHTGRTAEALRTYDAYRRRLATDLGLSPSEEIVQLERAIVGNQLKVPSTTPRTAAIGGYIIHELIDEGSFARVYRGTQPSVGRDVAIKQIRSELSDRPDFIRRFEFEAHLVAKLEHPHIVPLYDFWREPGSAYLVMRWIRGGSLERRLADGAMPFAVAVGIVRQVGAGLSSAHRAGVVHRDVKPANVLLDEWGNAYLTDFGIAADATSDSSANNSLGSPAYAAPEQITGGRTSPRTDIHALGTVLHELLTGRVPFGDSPNEVVLRSRQVSEPLPPLEGDVVDVPAGIDQVIATATAKDADDRYATVEEFVEAVERLVGEPSVPQASDAQRHERTVAGNPYRGLRSFDEADAAFFHGRQAITATLVERLGRRSLASFVALVGPSGSGKSSLVKAGVIPALRRGAIQGSDDWFVTTMVPGADPFHELSLALRRIAMGEIDDLAARIRSDAHGLLEVLPDVTGPSNADVLLVVDQFEELFTHGIADDELRTFIETLRVAVETPNSGFHLIVTLRADFYDRPLHFTGFAELLSEASVAIPPLAPDELEQAIRTPAELAGVELESGLVAELIADVGTQPGALPLLQYAMTELFERRSGHTLTRASYQAIGRLTGAIAARADQIYVDADHERQRATRRLIMRLVAIDGGSDDARRRVHRTELGDDPATAAMIEAFGAARLLAFDRDPNDRTPTVEVAHEALIREWPRLQRWLGEDRAGLRIHRQLTAAARAWDDGGRDVGDLIRGLRLAATEDWAGRSGDDLNQIERELLDASLSRRDAEAEAEAERKAALHRQNRKLRKLVVVAVTIALLAATAGLLAAQQRGRAADRAFVAETARLASSAAQLVPTDQRVALLLAAEAYRRDPNNESLGALQRVLTGTGGLLRYLGGTRRFDAVTWLSDDRLVAGNADGFDVFDLTSDFVRHVDFPGVRVLAASPATGLVAAGTSDSVVLLDATVEAEPRAIAVLDNVLSLTFSPDGSRVLAGTSDGSVLVIDTDTAQIIGRFVAHPEKSTDDLAERGLVDDALPHVPPSSVRGTQAIAFNAGGTLVATAGYGYVRLWDAVGLAMVGEHALVHEIPRADGRVSRVAVSGIAADFGVVDGRSVVTIADRDLAWTFGIDPVVQVGVMPLPARDSFIARGDLLSPVMVSRERVVTAAISGSMTVVTVGAEVGGVERHLHDVGKPFGLGIRPDGSVVAVAGSDGIVLISLVGDGLIATATDRFADGGESGLSRDGSVIAWATSTTYEAGIWRFDSERPRPIPIDDVEPFYVFVSADGRRAVALDDRQGALLVDTADGEVIATLQSDVSDGAIPAMSESAVALVEGGGLVTVFDADDGSVVSHLHDLEQRGNGPAWDATLYVLTFDPSGERLIGTGPGGLMVRWNLVTGEVDHLAAAASRIAGGWLTFSSDGRYALVSYSDGIVTVFDAETLTPVGRTFGAGEQGYGNGSALTDDGRYLVSTSGGYAQVWNFHDGVRIGGVFPADDTWVASVSPDGRWATTGLDGRIVRWAIDIDRWYEIACDAAGRNLTRAEWDTYGPRDRSYAATCPRHESLAQPQEA